MNFIGEYQLQDTTVCDKLIEYFESSDRQFPGRVGGGLHPDIKDSTDVSIWPNEIEMEGNEACLNFMLALDKVLDLYVEEYPECDKYGSWSMQEALMIQKYLPGQGYKNWHTERVNSATDVARRHLVFMVYLNDVPDGGTEFKLQNLTVEAKKGKVLFWPVDWTHTHRGQVSHTNIKYIATGWFSFN
jgi:prolyl 4-hydroxylase